MKITILASALILGCLACSCAQSLTTDLKGVVESYFASRSNDLLNKTDNSKAYRAKTYYGPGTENAVRTFVIDRVITIVSVTKGRSVIDSEAGTEGDVYKVQLTLNVQSELKDSRLLSPKLKTHKVFMEMIQTEDGIKINTDSSGNTNYVFDSDLGSLRN